MGNTLGCSVFCARPSVPTNKKYPTKNNLKTRKKNWLQKRHTIPETGGKSSTFAESTTRQQAADVDGDTKYQEFLEKNFIVKACEGHTPDELDSEFDHDILLLNDGYMKASDFRRFVEENFHKWDKKKPHTKHQAEFTDFVKECKQPDTVLGFIEADQDDANTKKIEEGSDDGIKRRSTIRTICLNETTDVIGETDNEVAIEKKKKKNALDRDNSFTMHGHSCTDIPDGNWSSFKIKLENCNQDNSRQSTNTHSSNSALGKELSREHWYISLESYANSAKNYTISHLQMEDKNKHATSMSMPNLSDIRYNPEHQSQHMTKSVLFESTEVYHSSLSRNTSTISRTDSSTDSGRSSNLTDLSTTRSKRVRSGHSRYLCSSDCALCRAAQIEYMVEVYEPLIVRQIRVTDILEFLPLIDERNKEIVRSKHCQSPHEAMEMLIKVIKRSDALGKWQSFLDAIRETEFTYISMLLNDETEVQYNYSTDVLSLIRPEIRNRMYLPDFLDKVFEKELITQAEKDEAISLHKETAAQTYILDRVDKHLPNWDSGFIEVLNESCMSDLADLFNLVSQKEATNFEFRAPAKGNIDYKLKRTNRKHRRQLIEKAHRNHCAKSTEHSVTGIYGLQGLPEIYLRDSANTAKKEGAKKCDEQKMKQEFMLQNVASEQMELKIEFKHLKRAILDQVNDIKDEITELRVCVNTLIKSNDNS